MAWGITLNKDGRQRLAGIIRGLLIAQLVVTLIMALFCYNSSIKVLSLLQKIHKVKVFLLYLLILLQAYCMKLHYTSGFRLLAWLLRYPHWTRTTAVNKMWLISGTLIAANGLLVHAACKAIVKILMDELSYSLHIGISQYLSEPSWKVLIDTMQVELNCCGADEPNDWHQTPWLNVNFVNADSDLILKLVRPDGKLLLPVAPFSCCTPHVITACCHDPFQLHQDKQKWPSSLAAASLSALGCTSAANTPLARTTFVLHVLSFFMLLLQVVIVALSVALRDAVAQQPRPEDPPVRSEQSVYRGAVARRRSMRRVRSRGYACLS